MLQYHLPRGVPFCSRRWPGAPCCLRSDDEYEEMQAAPATDAPPVGGGTNPFLAAPDASRATEYKPAT